MRPHSPYYILQLANEDASPAQNPFKDLLGRYGISTTPPSYFPPSPLRQPQVLPEDLRVQIQTALKEGRASNLFDMSSSPSFETANSGNSPSPTHEVTSTQHSHHPHSSKASEGAPSTSRKGKEILTEDVPLRLHHTEENAPEDASYPHNDDEDASDESYIAWSSPETSPEPYDHLPPKNGRRTWNGQTMKSLVPSPQKS